MGDINLRYEDIGTHLLGIVPEATPVLNAHVAEHGELLPHILFGELARWAIHLFRRWQKEGDESDYATFTRIIAFMQQCLHSEDERVQELVLFSFLENLWQAGEAYPQLQQHLTPELREWLHKVEAWWQAERPLE